MPDFFALATQLARSHRQDPPVHKALEAAQLCLAAELLLLAAQRLLANQDLDKLQHESMLTWSHCAEEWLTKSGYPASSRAQMRAAVRQIVERPLVPLTIVRRTTEALTEISETSEPEGLSHAEHVCRD